MTRLGRSAAARSIPAAPVPASITRAEAWKGVRTRDESQVLNCRDASLKHSDAANDGAHWFGKEDAIAVDRSSVKGAIAESDQEGAVRRRSHWVKRAAIGDLLLIDLAPTDPRT